MWTLLPRQINLSAHTNSCRLLTGLSMQPHRKQKKVLCIKSMMLVLLPAPQHHLKEVESFGLAEEVQDVLQDMAGIEAEDNDHHAIHYVAQHIFFAKLPVRY